MTQTHDQLVLNFQRGEIDHLRNAIVVILKKNNPTERNPHRYAIAYWDGWYYHRWLHSKGFRVIAKRDMTQVEKDEFKDCNRFIYWNYYSFEEVIAAEKLYADVLLETWFEKLLNIKSKYKYEHS